MYVYMSVTLRIATHVARYITYTNCKHVADRRRQLCRLRVQRHRGRADEASRASARTVDRQRRRVIRQQVGHGDICHSQG